jgi:hypothetical protein
MAVYSVYSAVRTESWKRIYVDFVLKRDGLKLMASLVYKFQKSVSSGNAYTTPFILIEG